MLFKLHSQLHDEQHLAVVAIELDLPLTGRPDGANARELELSADVVAGERQLGFAGRPWTILAPRIGQNPFQGALVLGLVRNR
jgi:hypothetical protein